MERLSPIDSLFCYLEGPTNRMHVGSLCVFGPPGFKLQRLRELVGARLPTIPAFTRRVVRAPLFLEPPMWTTDRRPDLKHHIRRLGVPPPGGDGELNEVVASLLEQPLDMSRPPWEMWLLEGMSGGRVAVLCKIHHSVVDGIAGLAVAASLLDGAPSAPLEPPTPIMREEPDPPLTPAEAAAGFMSWLAASPARSIRDARTVVHVARTLRARNRRREKPPPPGWFSAPRTPLNGAVGTARAFASGRTPVRIATEIASRTGSSVNDVVLAAVSGGLRAWLARIGEVPDRPLVAMVPVAFDRRHAAGNGVTGMLTSLATDLADPLQRLQAVSESCRCALRQHLAMGRDALSSIVDLIPPPLAAGIVRAHAAVGAARTLPPPFNVVVSYIPGPESALFCLGAPLLEHASVGPILDSVGLNVTVMRYCGELQYGLLASSDLVDDLDELTRGISRAFDELSEAAARMAPVRRLRTVGREPARAGARASKEPSGDGARRA